MFSISTSHVALSYMTMLLSYILSINSQTPFFNYEITERILDQMLSQTSSIHQAIRIPQLQITDNTGRVNLMNIDTAMQTLLYPVKHIFSQIEADFMGFESGLFYGYLGNNYEVNNQTVSIDGKEERLSVVYKRTPGGLRTTYVSNHTYDCRGRAWYKAAKDTGMESWVGPYFSSDPDVIYPIITLAVPLYMNDKDDGNETFVGALGIDFNLENLNVQLQNDFNASEQIVFILDGAGENLIAINVKGTVLSDFDASGEQGLLQAATLGNGLISGATQFLSASNFPQSLQIYRGHYLQSSLFVSTNAQGLSWHVVVLVEIKHADNALLPDNPYYNVVVAVATIALIVTASTFLLVLYYEKTKLFKLTQPALTYFVLLGNVSLCILCFVLLGPNTVNACRARPYLFNLSYTFTFGIFFIKALRIYDIFILHPLQKVKNIQTTRLIGRSLYLVLFDIIILASTLYASNGTDPIDIVEEVPGGLVNKQFCAYIRNYPLLYTEVAYKTFLMLISCVISVRLRDVPGPLAGSRVLLVIVYNTALVSAIILSITQLTLNDVPLTILIQAVGISFCVVVNCSLYVFPLVYTIVTIGDEKAVERIMEDMFLHKKQTSSYSDVNIRGSRSGYTGTEARGGASAIDKSSKAAIEIKVLNQEHKAGQESEGLAEASRKGSMGAHRDQRAKSVDYKLELQGGGRQEGMQQEGFGNVVSSLDAVGEAHDENVSQKVPAKPHLQAKPSARVAVCFSD